MFPAQIVTSAGALVADGGTLTAGQTYYAELSPPDVEFVGAIQGISVELDWDNAIIATVAAEATNHGEATAHGASYWKSQSPSPVPVVNIAGGAAGGQIDHWSSNFAGRSRLKIVVGGTGGVLTIRMNHKR